ncbi:unnamed protein product [Discosporangium mesarthrocarpum]
MGVMGSRSARPSRIYRFSAENCVLFGVGRGHRGTPSLRYYWRIPSLAASMLVPRRKTRSTHTSVCSVFSQFGKIVDIVACRGLKLKGQAWVVFAEKSMATNALRQMQGFPFYEKNMKIQFAKTESDVITKKNGTYVAREKRKLPQPMPGSEPPPAVRQRIAEVAPPATSVAPPAMSVLSPGGLLPPVAPETVPPADTPGVIVPHNILYATDLPPGITQIMLQKLFEQYSGFKEARMAPGGQAFIEFQDAMQAGVALNALKGFNLTSTQQLQLDFARKA